SNGFLWIGTQRGLYRFDGVHITRYGADIEGDRWIPASFIQNVSEGKFGQILISTYGGGVLRLDKEQDSFQLITEPGDPHLAETTDLHIDENNIVWMGTSFGLYAFDLSTTDSPGADVVQNIDTGQVRSIGAIASHKSGKIYFASGTEVYELNPQSKTQTLITQTNESVDSSDWITSLVFDEDGQLYIGTAEGLLVSMQPGTSPNQRTVLFDGSKSISISDLLVHNNTLWVGTNHGLYYSSLNRGPFKSLFAESSRLSSSDITTLTADNDQIWVGTFSGLDTISYGPFESFNQANSNVFDDVQAFTQGANQNTWIGTYNGLFRFDPNLDVHIPFEDLDSAGELADQRIMTMSSTDSELWLGFERNGIQIIDLQSLDTIPPPANIFTRIEVTKILHTSAGSVWIASFNDGIFKVQQGSVESYFIDGRLPEKSVTIIVETTSGNLIASTERKMYLYRSDSDEFELLDHEFLVRNRKVNPLILSISQNANGDIWIGTKEHGLFIWPVADRLNGIFTIRQSNLVSDSKDFTIYAIEFDENGHAWCSTQAGIIKLDATGILLAQYSTADGLQGSDFNFGASFQDIAGRIYFGGSQGYNRFDPSAVDATDVSPDMALLEIDVPGSGKIDAFEAKNISHIQLTHKDYFVQFVFSVLDFLDPDKNIYRYMLEGFDPVWIENGNSNTASYTRIPPGDYTLRVQGANSAGVWNRQGLSIGVEMLPPPWLTAWAYSVYALVGLFAIWVVKRIYDSYAIERRATALAVAMVAAEERAEDELVEQVELHDELVKSVYRHNISTLQIIEELLDSKGQSFTDDDAKHLTMVNIDRVEALRVLEECLFYQQDILSADLNRYAQAIVDKLLSSFPFGAEAITTINEVDPQMLPFEIASPVAVIMYELLENVVKHAFDGPGPHYVHIRLQPPDVETPDSRFQLTIEDNGCGLPPSLDVQSASSAGLATVNAMVARLSGEISATTSRGSLFIVTFPPLPDN
ncbi:MAG: triple tyrosine motif-containing protein, partial [Pseudomonadota bacterium]